jgi:hypothetical protein
MTIVRCLAVDVADPGKGITNLVRSAADRDNASRMASAVTRLAGFVSGVGSAGRWSLCGAAPNNDVGARG